MRIACSRHAGVRGGIGTAMTVDLLNGEGRHLGGAIVPGPALMVEALLTQPTASAVARRAVRGTSGLFGRSTRAAIMEGARYAGSKADRPAVQEARALVGRRPLVVLTGGEAPALRGSLQSAGVAVPDLVLRGLAILAAEPKAGPPSLH